MPVRKRGQQREGKLVNQWLWKYHRTAPQWRRVRLGIMPSHEMGRMYSVLLRWADAVFLENGIVHIVEAKMRPKADAIGQLMLYEKLFRSTPEFMDYWKWPIKLVYLCTMVDLALVELCSEKGIKYEVFELEDNWYNMQHDKLTV